MNQLEKNNIVLNNYCYISYEDLKNFFQNNPLTTMTFPPISLNQNSNNNIITKAHSEYKIIKNEINFNVIDKPKIEEEKSEKYSLQETKHIAIEIKEKEKEKEEEKHPKKRFFKTFCLKEKKKGRKSKESIEKGYHTKYSYDNILRKIKVKFFKKFINYINNIIKKKYSNKIKLIKPLNGKVCQNNTINFNQKLLKSKLKLIFMTNEINGKFHLYDKYYNEIVIKKIYEENIIELINIFEMTFLEAFQIFRDSHEIEKLNGFEKLDNVIEDLKNNEQEDDEYIYKFKIIAMNFEKYYLDKKPKVI